MPDVRSAVTTPALLGECPLWSPAEDVLYWLDIDGQKVHRFDPSTDTDLVRDVQRGRPGAAALTSTPGVLILAVEQQLFWFTWATGLLTPFTDLGAPSPDRLNDGRTDPAGRFVIGSMQADQTKPASQSVHQVEADGASAILFGDVAVTNGIAFDPIRRRMYFADTPTETITVFDYDTDTGACENGRQFVDYADIPGKPDGACVDAEGFYWSASVYGWAVTRFSPAGDVDRRIEVPLEKPSMPAFGGPNMQTLYVTTIGSGGALPSAPGRDGFVPGSLLAIDVSDIGCTGVADPVFAGAPAS